jgi:hypothetical protein
MGFRTLFFSPRSSNFISLVAESVVRIAIPRNDAYVSLQYEGVTKVFWTGAAIYTAVVVARSTGVW